MERLVGAVVWGVSACPQESWHLCEQPITCASRTPICVFQALCLHTRWGSGLAAPWVSATGSGDNISG